MAVRNTYTMRDERLMWEYVFEKLQTGDEAVYKPKGLKLWKDFEATQKTNKTASSLATHFRKAMYDRIEEAKLSVEQQLYIASQLKIPLSKRQQITIEYKANVSIITNSLGIVTAYEKEGKQYLPSLLKRKISHDDDNIKDELGYDAFKLNGSMTKIAKISRKTDGNSIVACSGRYNLRKKLNIQNNNSSKIHNSEETESMDSMQDIGDCNDSQNEDRNDGDSQSEIFHAGQIFDDKKHSDSKESEVIISCPKDETDIVNFRSENDRLVNKISADQVDCLETTESESGINQHTTARSNDMKMLANEASKTVVCSNISTWAAAVVKRKQELRTFENIIDEELKQLLAYIKNKRQLRGVEKMKMEKILELRAKEAKRLGMGLRSYLRKIATITD